MSGTPGGPAGRGIRDHLLSIAFGLMLAVTLVAQAVVGMLGYNEEARTAGLQEVSLARYATSSAFAVDIAENWQSEFLQFTLFILLTIWLVQRGSSESKKPGEEGRESDQQQLVGPFARPDSPAWAKAGGWRTALYSRSLSLVMVTVFALSWLAQGVAGRVATNEERLRDLLEPLTLGQYLTSPDFWGRTLQNWQSEFLAVGTMVVFAIYLRERGSPESKPVGAPHAETTSG